MKGEELEKPNLQGSIKHCKVRWPANITEFRLARRASIIRIRGLSTFGDNDPLIFVDGIVYDSEGLNALNPSDIESVNVLKDEQQPFMVRAQRGHPDHNKRQ